MDVRTCRQILLQVYISPLSLQDALDSSIALIALSLFSVANHSTFIQSPSCAFCLDGIALYTLSELVLINLSQLRLEDLENNKQHFT